MWWETVAEGPKEGPSEAGTRRPPAVRARGLAADRRCCDGGRRTTDDRWRAVGR